MFKQELPLLYPRMRRCATLPRACSIRSNISCLRHEAGLLRTDFKAALGTVSYQSPVTCGCRTSDSKTRDLMRLVPGTSIDTIERCSGITAPTA